MNGEHTYREIMSQPDVWRETLAGLEARRDDILAFNPQGFDEVIVTGCGSTYDLALAAAALI